MQIGDAPASTTILSAGLSGLQRNLESFRKAVAKATEAEPLRDLPEKLIEMTRSQRGVEASTASIRAADEMVGTLLDILA